MFKHNYQLRVRYGDTDQMGYVYYGNYGYYYEQARSEAIRSLGFTYKQLEGMGTMMPITRMNVKYISPAFYDEMLTIETTILYVPHRLIDFAYRIFNEEGKLINEGNTQLIFIDMASKKVTHAPQVLVDALKPYYE